MQKIEIISFETTGIFPAYSSINSLLMDSEIFGGGGFGKLYKCLSINNQPTDHELLIKILNVGSDSSYQVIQKLQKKLAQTHSSLVNQGGSLFEKYEALQAAPIFSFKGNLNGELVQGYSFLNLCEIGYSDFENLLEDVNELEQFQESKSFEDKLIIMYHLILGLELLAQFGFIHADLKDCAIFYNPSKNGAALIDYDGGTFINDGLPCTAGSMQDWLAPEITRIIGRDSNLAKREVSFKSDQWSIAYCFLILLTGYGPYDSFREISDNVLKEYLQVSKWPYAGINLDFIDDPIQAERIANLIEILIPKPLLLAFEKNFTQGYFHPEERLDYTEWRSLVESIAPSPTIASFRVDNDFVEEPQEITFTWNVTNFCRLFLHGKEITNQSTFKAYPTESAEFELKAINLFGKESTAALPVVVKLRPPEIEFFEVDKLAILKGASILLKWSVKYALTVEINDEIGVVMHTDEIELSLNETTNFTLIAKSGNEKTLARLTVTVLPIPFIKSLCVPCPDFISEIRFDISIPRIDYTNQ
ncbi:MAG: serine/threonine protein kinase, partial [Crocinitomix sp.]|nr:serine/threonine protein kinase [Crocinitomix sp.]